MFYYCICFQQALVLNHHLQQIHGPLNINITRTVVITDNYTLKTSLLHKCRCQSLTDLDSFCHLLKSQIQRCRHNGSFLQCSHSGRCCRYDRWQHTRPNLAQTDSTVNTYVLLKYARTYSMCVRCVFMCNLGTLSWLQ